MAWTSFTRPGQQVPNVTDVDILQRCSRIKAEFEKGLRKLFNPMIEIGSGADSPSDKLDKAVVKLATPNENKISQNNDPAEDELQKLVKYLYENKVATIEQIRRDVLSRLSERHVTRKLKGLEEEGLLQGYYESGLGKKKVYSISSKAFHTFVAPGGTNLPQVLKSEVVAHDLVLTDIRRRFDLSTNVKRYWPENLVAAMKSSDDGESTLSFEGVNPDGLVEIDISGETFPMAVEYETAQKYGDRYEQLFESYYSNSSIAGVLYICRNAKLLAHIRAIELSSRPDERLRKVYYSDHSQWGPGPVFFTNLSGRTIHVEAMSNERLMDVPNRHDDPECGDVEVDKIADDSDENSLDISSGPYRDASRATSNLSNQSNPPTPDPIS